MQGPKRFTVCSVASYVVSDFLVRHSRVAAKAEAGPANVRLKAETTDKSPVTPRGPLSDAYNRRVTIRMVSMCATLLVASAGTASAQASPPASAAVTIGGKILSVNYSAPSVR